MYFVLGDICDIDRLRGGLDGGDDPQHPPLGAAPGPTGWVESILKPRNCDS